MLLRTVWQLITNMPGSLTTTCLNFAQMQQFKIIHSFQYHYRGVGGSMGGGGLGGGGVPGGPGV